MFLCVFQPHVRIWDLVSLKTLQVIGEGEFARGVCCVSFSKMVGENLGCVHLYTPRKLCLWEGILFSGCPSFRPNESVSVTFCFLNILKKH